MLDRVDVELGHDKTDRDRLVGVNRGGPIDEDRKLHRLGERHRKSLTEFGEIVIYLYRTRITRGQKLPLYRRDAEDTAASILQMHPSFVGLHRPCLQGENARNNLKAIGHPMLHLAKEHLLVHVWICFLRLHARMLDHVLLSSERDRTCLPGRPAHEHLLMA